MKIASLLPKYGVLVAFLALATIYAVWQPGVFLQPEFLKNLVNQNAAVGTLAVGMTLVIVIGGIDLSVGSLMALTASLGLLAMNHEIDAKSSEAMAVMIAAAVSLGSGLLFGALNGLVITLGKVAPFVATLAGLVAFRSVALAIADGGEIRSESADLLPNLGNGGLPIPFLHVSGGQPLVITYPILVFFGSALVAGFLLNRTRYGRYVVAIGANERAAIYSAIPVNRIKIATYTLMGLFTGIAAIGSAARTNSVSTGTQGLYFELDAIAAVVIGGASLKGGSGRIWSTVVGVLMLGLINDMLVTENVSAYWQGCVKGVIILLAVLIQRGQGE